MANLTGTYDLDPAHTKISFTARHAMVTKVRGSFDQWSSDVVIDQENPENSNIDVVIQAASVNTGSSDRDAHIHGDDFFAVDKYPEIKFSSTKFNLDENGNGTIDGDLTIRDTTKPVTLDVEVFGVEEDPFGNTRAGFEASTKINRKDFGVDFQAPMKSGGVLVSEQIGIEIEGSGIKRAEA
ncbi:YceI family protein [Corynebacterium sp. S7]